MTNEPERRGSRSRALERSLSYSEAIGNGSGRSSIEIPRMVNTDVYTNEELKKHYRISQTYVEGKEIAFPSGITNYESNEIPNHVEILGTSSQYSSEDEHTDLGLTMTIDIDDSAKSSDVTKMNSNSSTHPMVGSEVRADIYDRIEVADSIFDDHDTIGPSAISYSTPFSKRKKKGTTHRLVTQLKMLISFWFL